MKCPISSSAVSTCAPFCILVDESALSTSFFGCERDCKCINDMCAPRKNPFPKQLSICSQDVAHPQAILHVEKAAKDEAHFALSMRHTTISGTASPLSTPKCFLPPLRSAESPPVHASRSPELVSIDRLYCRSLLISRGGTDEMQYLVTDFVIFSSDKWHFLTTSNANSIILRLCCSFSAEEAPVWTFSPHTFEESSSNAIISCGSIT